jgi:hypothetical protein
MKIFSEILAFLFCFDILILKYFNPVENFKSYLINLAFKILYLWYFGKLILDWHRCKNLVVFLSESSNSVHKRAIFGYAYLWITSLHPIIFHERCIMSSVECEKQSCYKDLMVKSTLILIECFMIFFGELLCYIFEGIFLISTGLNWVST